MKRPVFFISFFLFLVVSANAQVSSSVKEQAKKRQSPKNEQRQIDDQMASQYFMNQEYGKAKEIYAKLYKDYQQINYFNQYVECLIRLKEFDEAEKKLKSFTKDNPNCFVRRSFRTAGQHCSHVKFLTSTRVVFFR